MDEPKFDNRGKICYNEIVALRKGGIIIEYEPKNTLLMKGMLLVPATILLVALGSNNVLHAKSMPDTKDRIKEIKIVEDYNIEKLIRRNKTKVASVFTRDVNITARSLETTRNENKEKTKTEATEEKTEKKITTEIKTKKRANKVKKETQHKNVTEKKETKKEVKAKKTEKKSGVKTIGKVSISRNMNLTQRTGLTKEEFKELVKHVSQDTSKFFYNNADKIYDLCAKYQINEIFFCGLISAESGWNIVGNHRRTHNYISLMSGGKLIHFSSINEGLTVAAQKLHNNYLTPGGKFYGGKTLAGVQKKFCPSGSWISLVYGRMSQMAAAAKKIK